MIFPTDRRHFLKLGAALPLALKCGKAHGTDGKREPPRRVIFICNSLGFYRPNFTPGKVGDLRSSIYLKSLEMPEKVTVFQNLFHPGMETSNHDSEKSFLTGAKNPEATSFTNTISVDQLLARKLGGSTRFPFLSFSIYDRGWGCSWNERGNAIPPMHDVDQVFNKLFGTEDLRLKRKRIADDQQILKSLRRDLQFLEASASPLEQTAPYRKLIGELQSQLDHEKAWLETAKPKVKKTLSDDTTFEFSTKIHNLFELAKLAFQTDSTRVITISLDWIYGAIKVPGATGGWHTLSHHGGRPEVLNQLSRVESNIIQHFNRFLLDLESIKEGRGTLLDHTTVVLGSNFGDASNHTCHRLPIIVAGGGHNHRQHHVVDKGTPLCNLWLELLHQHDIDAGRFGSSEKSMDLLS